MEETVKQFLVRVKERVEFMGKGEDHVEIRGINHLGPAFIYPEFFFDSLAVGAAAAAAGIVMDLYMAAFRTLVDAVTEPARLTV